MENNHHGHHHQRQQQHHQVESSADDFLEQILTVPSYASETDAMQFGQVSDGVDSIALQLGTGSNNHGRTGFLGMPLSSMGISMPLGLNSFDSNASSTITSESNGRDSVLMTNLFPAFGNLQTQSVHPTPSPQPTQLPQQICNQPAARTGPNPPMNRPRVRARRGQATDPHSIAERLRRERISERMRALQELVPSCNKTDRAAMLDEIVDYVKFLRLQVKVLSMSRLGGAGAVAQLVSEVPSSSIEVEEGDESKNNQAGWDKGSIDGIEEQVAKLMEEDVGAAMQLLQSKALCIMPISLASAIFPNALLSLKPESDISS